MSALETLTAAQDLIRDPANWTQHEFARDYLGDPVDLRSPNAVCFCTSGALRRVNNGNMPSRARDFLDQALDEIHMKLSFRHNIPTYNDTHTHADIMAMFDKARELAAATGS